MYKASSFKVLAGPFTPLKNTEDPQRTFIYSGSYLLVFIILEIKTLTLFIIIIFKNMKPITLLTKDIFLGQVPIFFK